MAQEGVDKFNPSIRFPLTEAKKGTLWIERVHGNSMFDRFIQHPTFSTIYKIPIEHYHQTMSEYRPYDGLTTSFMWQHCWSHAPGHGPEEDL